jgi:VanZ family protein
LDRGLIGEEHKRILVETSKVDLSSRRNRFFRYGPLVIWALLIFIGSGSALSAEHTSVVVRFAKWLFPSATPDFLAWFHFSVRKAGHLTEYAILATLAARAFRNSSHQFVRVHWFKLSLLLAAAYALTDEFHQSFVPSRTASIHDSLIDSAGALIALIVIWSRHRKTQEFQGNTSELPLEH